MSRRSTRSSDRINHLRSSLKSHLQSVIGIDLLKLKKKKSTEKKLTMSEKSKEDEDRKKSIDEAMVR